MVSAWPEHEFCGSRVLLPNGRESGQLRAKSEQHTHEKIWIAACLVPPLLVLDLCLGCFRKATSSGAGLKTRVLGSPGPGPFPSVTSPCRPLETAQDLPFKSSQFLCVVRAPPPYSLKWLECSVSLSAELFLPQCWGISGHKLFAD